MKQNLISQSGEKQWGKLKEIKRRYRQNGQMEEQQQQQQQRHKFTPSPICRQTNTTSESGAAAAFVVHLGLLLATNKVCE